MEHSVQCHMSAISAEPHKTNFASWPVHPSLKMYNSLVERCFRDCVDDMRTKALAPKEEQVGRRLICDALSMFIGVWYVFNATGWFSSKYGCFAIVLGSVCAIPVRHMQQPCRICKTCDLKCAPAFAPKEEQVGSRIHSWRLVKKCRELCTE